MHWFLKFIFGIKLYMFRTIRLSIIRSFFFFYCTHINGICHTGLLTACQQDQDGTGLVLAEPNLFRPDPAARKLSANLYDIYHWCVYSEKLLMMGQRNCPKHVDFYSKNKFEKLVYLVGFIIKIYLTLNWRNNCFSPSTPWGCHCHSYLILTQNGGVWLSSVLIALPPPKDPCSQLR